jgi:hypothetical protein
MDRAEQIHRALRKTLSLTDNARCGSGYYSDKPESDGWIDMYTEDLEEALLLAGWTPPAEDTQ